MPFDNSAGPPQAHLADSSGINAMLIQALMKGGMGQMGPRLAQPAPVTGAGGQVGGAAMSGLAGGMFGTPLSQPGLNQPPMASPANGLPPGLGAGMFR